MAGWAREPESTVMTARSSHAGTHHCWFVSCLAVTLLAAPCGAQCGYEVTGVIRRTGIAGLAINGPGQVAGSHQRAFGPRIAYRWEGFVFDLPMPPGTLDSTSLDLNDAGTVVGWFVLENDGLGNLAFVYDGAEMRTLGVLPGHNVSEARGVTMNRALTPAALARSMAVAQKSAPVTSKPSSA